MNNLVEVHVIITDYDEYGTARPTMAIDLGEGLYKLLPIDNYDTADETWEFPPGSIVRTTPMEFEGMKYQLAVQP